jgi:hypothetical protein
MDGVMTDFKTKADILRALAACVLGAVESCGVVS